MFKFWKKKEKKDEPLPLSPLPPIEKREEGKDELEIVLLKMEKLELRLQNIDERLDKLEKMIEEIYRIAKS